MKGDLIALLSTLAIHPVCGVVVSDTNVILSDGVPSNYPELYYQITLYQDTAGTDPTSMWFTWNFQTKTLSFDTVNIDESSEWYMTSFGDHFSERSILGNEHDVFFDWSRPTNYAGNDQMVTDEEFYWGFKSGSDDYNGTGEFKSIYGWFW